jgi:hypothetical protein
VLIIRRINCINTTSGICHSVSLTVSCAGRQGNCRPAPRIITRCTVNKIQEIYVVDNFQTGSTARLNGYQVKRPEREVRHFQLSSSEIKNERNCTPSPTICFSGLYRNSFTFSLDIRCTLFFISFFFLKINNVFLYHSTATSNHRSCVK